MLCYLDFLGFNVLNFTCETHVISLKLEVNIAILKKRHFQLSQSF